MSKTIFIRLLSQVDKATGLANAIACERAGESDASLTHTVDPSSFRLVPGSPFAYWVSDDVRGLFRELPPFASSNRSVQIGLATQYDFRFVRLWSEVAPTRVVVGQSESNPQDLRNQKFSDAYWVPFAKGGE